MSFEGQKFYPGDMAEPRELLLLADEYLRAAKQLRKMGRRGKPLSRAPYRLVAIHAVELYLNALLIASGMKPAKVRELRHDLAQRADLAAQKGLKLRDGTRDDLKGLSSRREYLAMRYEPDLPTDICQPNRLEATLDEVAEKVRAIVDRDEPRQ